MPPEHRERIDVYLSRKAAATWEGAVVAETADGFVLRRRDRQEVLLGRVFNEARQALALLRKHEAPPEPEQP